MKHSLKAALWSALVLPGVGHVVLKRYVVGLIFALVAIIALSVIVAKVFDLAYAIVDQLNSGSIEADSSGLIGIISQSMVAADTSVMNTAFLIYLATWILSILDAYRIGDLLDKRTHSGFKTT